MKKADLLRVLRSNLFRGGINRFDVKKFIEDWDDHLSTHIERSESYRGSIEEAEAEAVEAFGAPEKVVEAATEQVRKSTIPGRHPVSFLALILLLFFLSVFVLCTVVGLLLERYETRISEANIATAVRAVCVAPEIISAAIIAVFSLFRPSGWKWLFVSALAISWAGTLPFIEFSSSTTTGGDPYCFFGLGFVGIDGIIFKKVPLHYDLTNDFPSDNSLLGYLKCEIFPIVVITSISGLWLYHFLKDPSRLKHFKRLPQV